ncbi:MAG: glycosyltransferase family 87 protein [Planctomycetota bacterium]
MEPAPYGRAAGGGLAAADLPAAPRWARGVAALALLAFAYFLFRMGGLHIDNRDPDFEYFYKAGAHLRAHGGLDPGYDVIAGAVEYRGTLDWYLPAVPRLMTLFAALPFRMAGHVWLLLNLAAFFATARLIGRELSGLPPRDWFVTQLGPVLLLGAYWTWEFRLNQINNFTLLLMVGSFVSWQRGHRTAAGFWLALATLLKVAPGLLILWFALKREFRVVAAALLTLALAGPFADAAALGPTRAADAYRGWWRRAVNSGSHTGLVLDQIETDWRNQGLGVVLSRWLHPTSYSTRFDNDPRIQAKLAAMQPEPPRFLNVVDLPRTAVARVTRLIAGISLVALFWLARRPARRLTLWQLRLEWALFILALLWFMPVLRRYHFIWAFPALAVLGGAIHYASLRSGWGRLALACIGLSVVLQLPMLSTTARDLGAADVAAALRALEAAGVLLFAVVVLALAIVPLLIRLGRAPDWLEAPPHPHAAAQHSRGVPHA